MNFLDSVAATFRAKTAPASITIAELIRQAETAVKAGRDSVDSLESGRTASVLGGEKARSEHRAALNAARDDLADTEAALEVLRGKHAAAIADEAEAVRSKRHKEATIAASALSGLVAEYEKTAKALRDTVRKIAEIDVLVLAANADLPAGVSVVADSGTLRAVPAVLRDIVSEKTLELWCRPGSSDPMAPEFQSQVAPQSDGSGYLSVPHGSPLRCVKRRFIRREFRAAIDHVNAPPFGQLSLPAAFAAKPDIILPPRGTPSYRPAEILASIDAAIAAEKAGHTKADRPVSVEFELVRDAQLA